MYTFEKKKENWIIVRRNFILIGILSFSPHSISLRLFLVLASFSFLSFWKGEEIRIWTITRIIHVHFSSKHFLWWPIVCFTSLSMALVEILLVFGMGRWNSIICFGRTQYCTLQSCFRIPNTVDTWKTLIFRQVFQTLEFMGKHQVFSSQRSFLFWPS